jgi:xanthine/CO dehydrogenase XdhC/CoxF family maturation factor
MSLNFTSLIEAYKKAYANKIDTVVATVVEVEGESNIEKGSRILLHADLSIEGCWEGISNTDIQKASVSVFRSGRAKMSVVENEHNERVFILLEKFKPEEEFLTNFDKQVELNRNYDIISFFQKAEGEKYGLRSIISLAEGIYTFAGKPLVIDNSQLHIFKQELSV